MDFNQFVPNVHFELIPIRNLVSNQEYQRSLSPTHVERAAAEFDIYQINPVKVSRRDGINFVFNGQHTIEIVASVSGSRETPVWCMIYDELSYKQEADIFANQMRFVKRLQPCEIFKANVEAENHDQMMVYSLLKSYRLRVGQKRGPGVICAIATVEAIYQKYGWRVLNRVFRLIVGTWEGDVNSFSANILNAVTKLVVTYGEALDDVFFMDRVGNISVKQMTRMAKDRRPGAMGFAEVMLIEYNGKKKNPAGKLLLGKLRARDLAQLDGAGEGRENISEADGEGQERMPVIGQETDGHQFSLQMGLEHQVN